MPREAAPAPRPSGSSASPSPLLPSSATPRRDAKPTQAPQEGLEWGINRDGQDYAAFRVPEDPAVCRMACEDDPQCAAFTYVKPAVRDPSAICQLKHGVPAPHFDDCCVSGLPSRR